MTLSSHKSLDLQSSILEILKKTLFCKKRAKNKNTFHYN